MFSFSSARAAKGSPCTDDSPRNVPHQSGYVSTKNEGVRFTVRPHEASAAKLATNSFGAPKRQQDNTLMSRISRLVGREGEGQPFVEIRNNVT